ncbi:MAG TPA: adenylate/guanylate cyclase domain-containing protein [Dongiaceae bacterium]|jgi:TolB-like protein|nr:adenylate/guanylate cyclase domain-containing protein [Dongiaceae bacterium]
MPEKRAKRRLAAVLAADVAGYNRLMQRDEAGTLAALKSRRAEILQPVIGQFHGRIVKLMGDGVLVEFASAVNAVACAVELQSAMEAANADVPRDKRIVFRIGINLGDIMVEGGDLFGDGVNIAARLEAMAEPGAVNISGSVQSQVKGKLPLQFEDLGEQNLKNIAEPVRVYRVSAGKRALPKDAPPEQERTSRPAIAVLPFANFNPDPEQQYLSDGITEDIITELARHRDFLVMARNTSFQYREKTVDVKRVGRELGVEYLVEGSLRKAGKRLRITAQLVEVATGAHLWAERYDRDVQDVFTIQDDVTQTIAATLVGQLGRRVAERTRRKPTESWAAYDYYLQGREYALFRYEPAAAKPLLQRSLELDPTFASAHAVLSFVLVLLFFDDLADETLKAALTEAQTALSLDENEPWSHLAMGFACTFLRRFELAGIHHAKSVALNPNDAQAAFVHAHWLTRVGRTEEALREFDRALRLDPFMPNIYWEGRAIAFMQARRHQEVIESTSRMNKLGAVNYCYLAAAYAHLGKLEQAQAHAAEARRLLPTYTERWVRLGEPFQNLADTEHFIEGLRKAGLQE